MSESALFVFYSDFIHHTSGNNQGREHRGECQSQLPASHICDNETAHERSREVSYYSNLLRYSLLNQICSSGSSENQSIHDLAKYWARLTSVVLNSSCHFASSKVVEEGYVLTQYGLEITLSNAFRVDLARINPDTHVSIRAKKQCYACSNGLSTANRIIFKIPPTNVHQITGILSSNITKMCSSLWEIIS